MTTHDADRMKADRMEADDINSQALQTQIGSFGPNADAESDVSLEIAGFIDQLSSGPKFTRIRSRGDGDSGFILELQDSNVNAWEAKEANGNPVIEFPPKVVFEGGKNGRNVIWQDKTGLEFRPTARQATPDTNDIFNGSDFIFRHDGSSNWANDGQLAVIRERNGSIVRGAALMPAYDSFVQAALSSSISLSAGTFKKVIWDNKVDDLEGEYNASTGEFSPNIKGRYQVDAQITYANAAAGDSLNLQLRINGSTSDAQAVHARETAHNSDPISLAISRTIRLAPSDTVSFHASNNGSSDSIASAGDNTYLSIHQLGSSA